MKLIIILTSRFYQLYDYKKLREKIDPARIILIAIQSKAPLSEEQTAFFDKVYRVNSKILVQNDPLPVLEHDETKNIIEQEMQMQAYTDIHLICLEEANLLLAAQLREELGLPGERFYDIEKFRNKALMKRLLQDAHIKIPRYVLFSKEAAANNTKKYYADLVDQLGQSIVLKPIALSASFGIYIVNGLTDFMKVLPLLLQSNMLYEADEYIHGTLYHCDFLLNANQVQFIACCEYSCPNLEFIFGKNLLEFPLLETDPLYKHITQFTHRCIEQLSPAPGAYHFEIFLDDSNNLIFLEAAARCPGTLAIKLYELMYGINMLEQDFYIKCNIDSTIEPRIQVFVMDGWFPTQAGQVQQLCEPTISSSYKLFWVTKIGDELQAPQSLMDYSCCLLAWNNDYAALRRDFELLRNYSPLVITK